MQYWFKLKNMQSSCRFTNQTWWIYWRQKKIWARINSIYTSLVSVPTLPLMTTLSMFLLETTSSFCIFKVHVVHCYSGETTFPTSASSCVIPVSYLPTFNHMEEITNSIPVQPQRNLEVLSFILLSSLTG